MRAESAGIQPERIQVVNDGPVRRGDFVLYWMQAAQRAHCNHALEYAILRADELGRPLAVLFVIAGGYPGANLRHYAFMLQGLQETRAALASRGIALTVQAGDPALVVPALARRASLLIMDRGYMPLQRSWRELVAGAAGCACLQVETEAVVPVEWASDREAYAARTLRPKIQRQLGRFLRPLRMRKPRFDSLGLRLGGIECEDLSGLAGGLGIDCSVPPVAGLVGGRRAARARLQRFLRGGLGAYAQKCSDPAAAGTSLLSPYLHFGQIAALEIALAAQARGGHGADEFLEQLIVRRELAINFAFYNPQAAGYSCLPGWARATLERHRRDRREHLYDSAQLENAQTHDPYWNAAQDQMRYLGHMHNYMRMYWGKKVIEWSETPQEAFRILLRLNDRYELDGRDPNGLAGVAWCFGKHDRPWAERPVFGTVRYMNAAGLRRKFAADEYAALVKRAVAGLARSAPRPPP